MFRILQVGYEAGARVGYENLNGSTQSEAAIAPSRSTGSTWPTARIPPLCPIAAVAISGGLV